MKKLIYAENEIKCVKPSDIKNLMRYGKAERYVLIDVRQPHEYQAGHIPGAVHVPLSNLEAQHKDLPRDRMVIVYCRSGHLSNAAAIALSRLGFKEICYLDGGIVNWPYEISKEIPSTEQGELTVSVDIRDILVLAVRQEKKLRDFYMVAKEKIMTHDIAWIFQMLADVEESHMDRLYQLATCLLDEKEFHLLEKLKAEFNDVLSGVKGKLENEVEALEMALEGEFLSHDFYIRTSGMVIPQNAQILLCELGMDERNHSNMLLKQLEKAIAR